MKKKLAALTLLLLSTAAHSEGFGDSSGGGVWVEREILERYLAQLNSLNQLLDEGQLMADKNRRVNLEYSQIKRDVHEITLKVQHYLDAPSVPFEQYRVTNDARY
ncbi:RAQPRD family integrative conjugative element protein [Vibrio agarivorans]|uniref:RAQPRD family integrative conjugative element protein n=1 Tax=Vibrio agarivorans TaxID=153622 RepID=A0ABT7Y7A2_9VIBR|nr:RAQPRD family integrative conjugative element protein [Vibrio agarivorans]MDN2483937.1 RAQPRD family integrative conjugative element protein [Vibrio agarivorans]